MAVCMCTTPQNGAWKPCKSISMAGQSTQSLESPVSPVAGKARLLQTTRSRAFHASATWELMTRTPSRAYSPRVRTFAFPDGYEDFVTNTALRTNTLEEKERTNIEVENAEKETIEREMDPNKAEREADEKSSEQKKMPRLKKRQDTVRVAQSINEYLYSLTGATESTSPQDAPQETQATIRKPGIASTTEALDWTDGPFKTQTFPLDQARCLPITNASAEKSKEFVDSGAGAATIESKEQQSGISRQFRIPQDRLENVDKSKDDPTTKFWSYSMYKGPQGQNVTVHYCRKIDASERIAQLFLGESLLGFDMEWKPNAAATHGIKKNVSLIQLAKEDRIALFHIALHNGTTIEELLPPTLKLIMEDPGIRKAGVAIKADCSRLKKFLGVNARGLFELSHLYKVVKNHERGMRLNRMLVSLANQVEDELQMPMLKGKVRSSDWSKELVMEQILYAASDAYAGVQLFATLDEKRRALHPSPPLPPHAELNLPISSVETFTGRNTENTDVRAENSNMELQEDKDELVREPSSNAQDNGMVHEFAHLSVARIEGTASDFELASQWATKWKSKYQNEAKDLSISHESMICYALWYHQGLETAQLCQLLERPLHPAAAAACIMEAISSQDLAYEQGRLEKLMRQLPESMLQSRFRKLSQVSRMSAAIKNLPTKPAT